MKIDQNYLELLLKPLEDSAVPNLTEYLHELRSIGVEINGTDGRINRKFETHLKYLSMKKMISNIEGSHDLEDIGITIGGNGHIIIIGHKTIMKAEVQDSDMPPIQIGSINSDQVQIGNNNTQITNINVQELVEKVAKSNDQEAKNTLKSLLQSNTVATVLGASISGLISILSK
jgi:sRNA-binding carbon storage regulator CsrA